MIMDDDQRKYQDCVKKKTKEYLRLTGKKTFTMDDLAKATRWATEQCERMEPSCKA